MDRSNAAWLAQLNGRGPEQQAALRDLRKVLLRGLRRALAGYPRANEAFLEDAVQEALLRILGRLQQFEGRSRFVTWATSIAIRTAMSELRRRRWSEVSLDDIVAERGDLSLPPGSSGVAGPLLRSEQRALVEALYEIIQHQLSDKQRTALLAELRGMPQIEIARHLGSNRNAVYKLTHDARKQLKRRLEARGYRSGDIHSAFSN